jgi:hypothetical protein
MHVDGAYANNTLYDGTIIMLVAKLVGTDLAYPSL